MTTFTSEQDRGRRLRELNERTRRAWGAYRESVQDLSGRDYEDAEGRSWDRLQRKLKELEDQRAELAEPGRRRGDEH